MARRIPKRIGNPKVQDMVSGPGTISDAYAYYGQQAAQNLGTSDLVNMIACQAGDPNCGPNVLQMLTDVMMGRNPSVQSQVRGGAANVLDAYYRMGNIGRPEKDMMTGAQRLRVVSDLLNRPETSQRLRGVPLMATGAGLLAGGAAIDTVTASPEEQQIRDALAAIQYMRG